MKEHFKLQFKILHRQLEESGMGSVVGYALLLPGFVLLSIFLFQRTVYAPYLFILLCLTLVTRLSATGRNEFLQLCLGKKQWRQTRLVENLLVALPFLVFLGCKQLWLAAGVLAGSAAFMAFVHVSAGLRFSIPTPFYKKPFEFIRGFRNTFYLVFVAYALTVIAIWVNNFNLGMFSLLFIFALVLTYYSKPENEYYVWVHSMGPWPFLFEKIKTGLLFSSLLSIPILVPLLFVFPHEAGIVFLFLLIGYAFLVCIIAARYSAYPHEMDLSHAVLFALCTYFPPLLVGLIPYFLYQSAHRLKQLLP